MDATKSKWSPTAPTAEEVRARAVAWDGDEHADAWDRDARAIRAGRAHARALEALRALSAEPARVKVRGGRVGVCDETRAARRDAIIEEAVREGADRGELIWAWQRDTEVRA